MVSDPKSLPFIRKHVTNHDRIPEAASYLNLSITPKVLEVETASDFIASHQWPKPASNIMFLCALSHNGEELGRLELDLTLQDAAGKVAEFVQVHIPPIKHAEEKWNAALAEAKRTNRKVWARISQRYGGPCFRLARWIDGHREQLERNYVQLKIDNVRENNGMAIANRVVGDRNHFGVPFHSIFDAEGSLLIDSVGPTGNIGHPTGFEGRRHLVNMLRTTRQELTDEDIIELSLTFEP